MITRNIASTLLLLILLAPPLHAIITGSAEEEPITIDSRASSKASTALAETAGQVKALVDAVKSGSGDLLSPSSKATNSLAAAEAAVKHEGVSVSGLKRKSWQAENAWRSRVTDVLYEFENHMTTTKKLSEDTVNSELKPFGLGKFLTTEISPGGGNVGGGISFGKEWKLEFIKSDDYNVRIVDSKFATAFFERFQYRPWHDPNSNIQAFQPSGDRPDPHGFNYRGCWELEDIWREFSSANRSYQSALQQWRDHESALDKSKEKTYAALVLSADSGRLGVDGSRQALGIAANLVPERFEAHKSLAKIAMSEDDNIAMEEHLAKAIELAPAKEKLSISKLLFLLAPERGTELLEKSIEKAEKASDSGLHYGAAKHFEKAFGLMPDRAGLAHSAAESYIVSENYSEAARVLYLLLDYTDDTEAKRNAKELLARVEAPLKEIYFEHLSAAEAAGKAAKQKTAIEHTREAIQIAPRRPEGYVMLAKLLAPENSVEAVDSMLEAIKWGGLNNRKDLIEDPAWNPVRSYSGYLELVEGVFGPMGVEAARRSR